MDWDKWVIRVGWLVIGTLFFMLYQGILSRSVNTERWVPHIPEFKTMCVGGHEYYYIFVDKPFIKLDDNGKPVKCEN